jgi:hypothetical protein
MLAVEALRKGDAAAARREVDLARQWPENLGAGAPWPADRDERVEDLLAAQAAARAKKPAEAQALRERAARHEGRERGAGALAEALALKQAGKDVEGRAVLAAWTARAPQSAIATWAAAAYEGTVAPLPEGATEAARVLAAWLQAGRP